MKITILTLFPEMFTGPFAESIIKRAISKKLVEIKLVNIRDFGLGKHKVVDDTPYGGGQGMILRADVLDSALEKSKEKNLNKKNQKAILLSPQGKTFNQKEAIKFSKLKHLIIVCGHYEGVDARFDKFIDEKVSIGDFVSTGGEIPAMLITDSVTRLVKGVLKAGVTFSESFPNLLEYYQYTKPRIYKGLKIPEILLSGNHKKISQYREKESKKLTLKLRPDLLQTERSQALLQTKSQALLKTPKTRRQT